MKFQILKRKYNFDVFESYISDVMILLKCYLSIVIFYFFEGFNYGFDFCIYGSYGGFFVYYECFKGIG